jgi:hypothetical protein
MVRCSLRTVMTGMLHTSRGLSSSWYFTEDEQILVICDLICARPAYND